MAFWSCIENINSMNNKKLAENCIGPFAVGCRGWLFADTPKGTEYSTIAYSIVETAKANNLNVFEYLNHLFKSLPNINFNEQPQLLEQHLPWSESLPECCYNKKRLGVRLVASSFYYIIIYLFFKYVTF